MELSRRPYKAGKQSVVVNQRRADAVHHAPYGRTAHFQFPRRLHRRKPFFHVQHERNQQEPALQIHMRVVEDRSDRDGKAGFAGLTFPTRGRQFALCVTVPADVKRAAVRANGFFAPPHIFQVLDSRFWRWPAAIEFDDAGHYDDLSAQNSVSVLRSVRLPLTSRKAPNGASCGSPLLASDNLITSQSGIGIRIFQEDAFDAICAGTGSPNPKVVGVAVQVKRQNPFRFGLEGRIPYAPRRWKVDSIFHAPCRSGKTLWSAAHDLAFGRDTPSSLARMMPRSTTDEGQIRAMMAAAWHRKGSAVIPLDEVRNNLDRQLVTNVADRLWGKRTAA